MKNLAYQQKAVTELIDKTIRLLNVGGQRNKLVFEATTGAGKTVMDCTTVVPAVIRKWLLYGSLRANCICKVTTS